MKQRPRLSTFVRSCAVLGTALLAFAAGSARSQSVLLDFGTNSNFATNGLKAAWHWWGGAATVQEWVTNDVHNDPTSGSVHIVATWPTGSTADYQYSVGLSLGGVSSYGLDTTLVALNYTNMEMDIMWDTNLSTINITNHMVGGDPNGFGFGFVATQYGQTWVPNANQPVLLNDGQWHHYVIPIDPAWPPIPGVIFKKYMGYNAANEGTVSAFYVDNIKFNYNTNAVRPKPAMVIEKAKKGLNIIAAQAGGQYQRNGIASIPGSLDWWNGNTNPVTYSVTISEFPSGAKYGGFQGHIFLSTDGSTTEPDWNNPSVVYVQFQQNAAGQGICNFRFKTNSPNSNGAGSSGFFGTGAIMSMTTPSVLGTWSVTFTNNSQVTIVGPGGVGTNFDMGADAAAWFVPAASMATYFGDQPNNPANIGQKMVYSEIKMTDGTNVVFDDTFPLEDPFYEINTSLWTAETDAGAIALKVVDRDAWWIDWNKPDGFLTGVNISSNLLSGWVDPGYTILDHGTRRAIYADTNTLANYPNTAFFQLYSTNAP